MKFYKKNFCHFQFTFDAQIRPEILSKPMDEKSVKMEDFTKGREAVPISLVNAVDNIEVDPNVSSNFHMDLTFFWHKFANFVCVS